MAKRFNDTDLYKKVWFRKLPLKVKCLWEWLRCNCDAAGVIDFDAELISFQIGDKICLKDLVHFGDRVHLLTDYKVWLTGFIEFQYGIVKKGFNPHNQVIKSIEKHNLSQLIETNQKSKGMARVPQGYPKGIATLMDKNMDMDMNMDMNMDMDMDINKNINKNGDQLQNKKTKCNKPNAVNQELIASIVLYLNAKTNKKFSVETKSTQIAVNARLKEGYTLDDFKKVIELKQNEWGSSVEMTRYIRPDTLFGNKFESYLNSAPDVPVESDFEDGPFFRELRRVEAIANTELEADMLEHGTIEKIWLANKLKNSVKNENK